MGESACLMRSFSHPSTASREAKEGDPIRALTESISFGRFMSESLAWEKWSTFSHNRYLEEVEQFSKPGSVAQKKAFFEAHYKKRAAMKAAALLGQANAAANDVYVDEIADEPYGSSPMYLNTTIKVAIDEQKEKGVDTELTHSPNGIVEPLEGDVLGAELAHSANANAFCLSENLLHHSENLKNTNVESGEEAVEESIQVENLKQLESAEDCNVIPATPERKMSDKETTEKDNVGLPSNKRQMKSAAKPPSQSRASKVQKSSAKQGSSTQPKTGTRLAPNDKKAVGDVMDKKRLTPTSIHMSINFCSGSSEVSRPREKDSSSTVRNPTRASVYGVSKLLPSIVEKQAEDRRLKPVHNKSASGGIIARGMSQTLSGDCTRSSSAGRNKARSPIISFPFSFKSEERAAKRKEFFQRLEGRKNVKEAEKSCQYKVEHSRQSAGLRAKASDDLHRSSQSPCGNAKKIPLTRPRSPKLGRKPSPSVVHEPNSRHAWKPSVNNAESSKYVGRKGNLTTTNSCTLPKKKAHENASPNIEH